MLKSRGRSHLDGAHSTDVGPRRVSLAVSLFAAIAVLIGVDLIADAADRGRPGPPGDRGRSSWASPSSGLLRSGGDFSRLENGPRSSTWISALSRAEAAHYRAEAREALQGLGEAIDSQFERWQLTAAEREVGLLMLKGLSHREVAEIRQTTEATVRQQALVVYRKSGLANRTQLSAFFLEDLLLPRAARELE